MEAYRGFMEYMQLGGTIMWFLLAFSVTALALTIEKVIFFSSNRGQSAQVEKILFEESFDEVGVEDLKTLLEQKIRRELYIWDRNLPLLEVIAKVSPLLGLLGTVLGMVEMFHSMSVGGTVNAAAVTGGIWKALFTTVAGLFVAIPTVVAHGLLAARVDRQEENLRCGADRIVREHCGASPEWGKTRQVRQK
jgi:biopolymer transport protein ExbB